MRLRSVLAAAAMSAAVLPPLLAAPAHAAAGDFTVTGSFANLSGNLKWVNGYRFELPRMTLRDTVCDDKSVYWYLTVDMGWTSEWSNKARWAEEGCGTENSWTGIHLERTIPIHSLRFWICRDDWGADTCEKADYLNPHAD
ncbi:MULTISPECIES: hypothetical protein [unclassified Streptomyces]|uniref:hypothetical protein n=1 Tax=unclassified Streptomyces TaxID=2593676 RepID=UPI001F43BD35|nr:MULTISPECIES: hypothetical protein [unclassified Streptomyces]